MRAILSGIDPKEYEDRLKSSWVYQELKGVRNVKPAIKKFGLLGGMGWIHSLVEFIRFGPDFIKFDHIFSEIWTNLPKSDLLLTSQTQ